ncbi:thermonuclease family protein (plasmid) [Rhizobium sp. 32-5/1]|uniref:thermonuclease family protein n=1 Tax=Rhizobium sp. 32-5/1 TaxID=3019602 RepID=UPI00240D84E8|nr:thermonuclease family protein [Rhizobium sp. 32-5/1]WEZ85963.1 thermonuclease family protein [Rhizobium sp. 32-5/1]
MIRKVTFAVSVLLLVPGQARAADLMDNQMAAGRSIVKGRVAVIDGRTLWFASARQLVRLSQIEGCELPQWAFDPKSTHPRDGSLTPVPCGALAKAWLKRTIGNRVVRCSVGFRAKSGVVSGKCSAAGRDLAHEMLRVGWARLTTPFGNDNGYSEAQGDAVAARNGMWATYVLDMTEWRRKAIDQTTGRRPLADLNLLSERRSGISPPFADMRRQPARRDR